MNANEMTFGIEIETTIPSGIIRVGPHGAGLPVPQIPGWLADRDPSIRVTTVGREACEFVSPVYTGATGLTQFIADLNAIKAMGAEINDSCGIHIHIGFDKTNVEACKKLVALVSNFEKAIFASTGTKKRESGRWCGGVQRHQNPDRAIQASRCNRYHVVNLSTRKPTVEFRAFAASLNTTKIVGHIMTCMAIVEKALTDKKTAKWVAKKPIETSPYHRNGDGQTALTKLFYGLGWTKGDTNHVFGNILGEGAPTLKEIKKELMRLAKKYDTCPA